MVPTLTEYKDYLNVRKLQFHEYQWKGLQWCLDQELDYNLPGGIVADEMGLGKTILMISIINFHLCLKTLIVVPPVLLNQWKNKIYEQTGHKPFVFHGQNKKNVDIEFLNNSPIVICSYHTIAISTDFPEFKALHKIKWNRIIFDECHHLRNSKTSLYLGAFNLKSKCRWFLSGTPIQNKLKDLTNIIRLLGYSQSKIDVEKVKTILFNKMLRRTKSDVGLNIPALHMQNIVVSWKDSHEDTSLSEDIHSAISFSGVSIDKQTDFGSFLNQNRVIVAMLRAKQVCVYPKLIYDYLDKRTRSNQYKNLSGNQKLQVILSTIIERKNNGKGKLIFCQFRDEIDFIKEALQNEEMLVGKIDGRGRDSLDKNYDVLILQIQSCCEGLNLQENFSEIYFTSNQWNPSVEEQAIGRCYRLGQKNEVYVFKYTMNTFDYHEEQNSALSLENYIQKVQQIKKAIADEYLV